MSDRSLTSAPSDTELDQSLRELFASADEPSLRTGFDRRIARAVEADAKARLRARSRRRLLGAYWLVSGATSGGIVWQFQEQLAAGTGLWLFAGGLATLAVASLALSALAVLPVGFRRT